MCRDPIADVSLMVMRVADLYRRGLSTRQIAAALGVGRRRVDAALRSAGVQVAPRGAGRARPAARHDEPDHLAEQLRILYEEERLTRRQVAEKLGISEGLVRTRLAEQRIPTRTRGRINREDRVDVAEAALVAYYRDRGLTAEAAGELLGVSGQVLLRAAHGRGLAVRAGACTARTVGAIRLIDALYADPLVSDALARHSVPVVPAGGPIWQRFPKRVPLTGELCTDLYEHCGVSVAHIELLTGQPADAIRTVLRRAGVTMRPPGGRCPFRRRWEDQQRVT